MSVYGFQPRPFDETTPRLRTNLWINYVRTKVLAEEEVRRGIDRGLDAVLLNPANMIGAYDSGNWSRLFRLVASDKLPGLPPGRGSFCHAAEVAKAHVSAVRRGRTGENYLLGGADASYVEVVRIIGEMIGRDVSMRSVSARLFRAAAWAADFLPNWRVEEPNLTPEIAAFMSRDMLCRSDKAISELGYQPVPLHAMLGDCYRWLIAESII